MVAGNAKKILHFSWSLLLQWADKKTQSIAWCKRKRKKWMPLNSDPSFPNANKCANNFGIPDPAPTNPKYPSFFDIPWEKWRQRRHEQTAYRFVFLFLFLSFSFSFSFSFFLFLSLSSGHKGKGDEGGPTTVEPKGITNRFHLRLPQLQHPPLSATEGCTNSQEHKTHTDISDLYFVFLFGLLLFWASFCTLRWYFLGRTFIFISASSSLRILFK